MSSQSSNNKKAAPINTLDQFRGIAILLVVLMHTLFATLKPAPPDTFNPISNLVYAGSTGVTLFFILSGILVSRPFIKGLKSRRMPDLVNYATQRALRIIPAYWIVAIASVVYAGAYDQLLPALFFQLEKVKLGYLSTIWWSLAVEVKFYIVLPLLFAIFNMRHGGKLLAGVAGCWAITFILVCTNPAYSAFATSTSLITRAPAFLVGIAISYWYENHNERTTKTVLLSGLGIAAIIALSAWLKPMAMATHAGYRSGHPLEIVVESLLWGVAIVCFLAQEKSGARSAMSRALSAPLRFLAKISYSLYLLHMPVILYCLRCLDGPDIRKFIIALLLSVALSIISHTMIEKPFLKLKEHLDKTPVPALGNQPS